MPVQNFALDPAGESVIQTHWNGPGGPLTLLMDNRILGVLQTPEECQAGKEFALPDGSKLYANLPGDQPQLWRNGISLSVASGSTAKTTEVIGERKRGGCLTTWLIVSLLLNAFLVVQNFSLYLKARDLGYTGNLTWGIPLYVVLGCLIIGGLIAIFLWKRVGFYIVVGAIVANVLLTLILGIFTYTAVTPFIGLAVLYYLLRRTNVWEHMA